MKRSITLLGTVIIATLIFIACTPQKKGDYLPPIKAEIPEALSDNVEAISYIEETTDALNKWSVVFEDLVVECEPYIGKDESELSTIEKLKLGKIMMEFVANIGQFAVNVAEIDQNTSTVEYDLNDEELEAMLIIINIFQARIEELNTKYQNFGKEDEDI